MGVDQQRCLTQVGEGCFQVLIGAGHEIAALPAHGDGLNRDFLVQDELAYAPVEIGVKAAAETPVGTDHQHNGFFHRADGQ